MRQAPVLFVGVMLVAANCKKAPERDVFVPGWRCAWGGGTCRCVKMGTHQPIPPEATHPACEQSYPSCIVTYEMGGPICECSGVNLRGGKPSDEVHAVSQCPPPPE